MTSGIDKGQTAQAGEPVGYEPPQLEVLGSIAELTQLGTAPPDELLNDGSIV